MKKIIGMLIGLNVVALFPQATRAQETIPQVETRLVSPELLKPTAQAILERIAEEDEFNDEGDSQHPISVEFRPFQPQDPIVTKAAPTEEEKEETEKIDTPPTQVADAGPAAEEESAGAGPALELRGNTLLGCTLQTGSPATGIHVLAGFLIGALPLLARIARKK